MDFICIWRPRRSGCTIPEHRAANHSENGSSSPSVTGCQPAVGPFRSAGSNHRFQGVRSDDRQPGRQEALRTEKSGNPLPHSTLTHLIHLDRSGGAALRTVRPCVKGRARTENPVTFHDLDGSVGLVQSGCRALPLSPNSHPIWPMVHLAVSKTAATGQDASIGEPLTPLAA